MKESLKKLAETYAFESQARNHYAEYSKRAKNEGYQQISAIISLTSEKNKVHSKNLFRFMEQIKSVSSEDIDQVRVEIEFPISLGKTIENLKTAISIENQALSEFYPNAIKTLEAEGYDDEVLRRQH